MYSRLWVECFRDYYSSLSLLRSLDNSATSPKSLNTPNNNKPLIAPPMAENKKEEAFFKKDKVVWKHIERIFSPVTWFMGWCVLLKQ